jgi:hypothetical protein
VFFVFTQCVHLVSFPNAPHSTISSSFLEFILSFSLGDLRSMPDEGYKCANKWCWIGFYGPNPFYLSKCDIMRKFMRKKSNFST